MRDLIKTISIALAGAVLVVLLVGCAERVAAGKKVSAAKSWKVTKLLTADNNTDFNIWSYKY